MSSLILYALIFLKVISSKTEAMTDLGYEHII